MNKLLGLALVLMLSACSLAPAVKKPAPHGLKAEIASYANDPAPTAFGRILIDEGCTSNAPCSVPPAVTYGISLGTVDAFSSLYSGINTQMQGTCADGCGLTFSGTGYIDANRIMGVNPPTNAALLGTGNIGQPVTVTPTGCIGAGSNQIFNVCVQLPNYQIGVNLPACNNTAPPTGTLYTAATVTNGQSSPPYLGIVGTTGTTVAPVFCNGVNWVYH
jgi:hypothetical protein